MNEIKHKHETMVANKDVKQPGIILPYIENVAPDGDKDEKGVYDIFALPGNKTVMGREKAEALALRHSLNPRATFKMKPAMEALADKIVTRIECSMRDDSPVMGA